MVVFGDRGLVFKGISGAVDDRDSLGAIDISLSLITLVSYCDFWIGIGW